MINKNIIKFIIDVRRILKKQLMFYCTIIKLNHPLKLFLLKINSDSSIFISQSFNKVKESLRRQNRRARKQDTLKSQDHVFCSLR